MVTTDDDETAELLAHAVGRLQTDLAAALDGPEPSRAVARTLARWAGDTAARLQGKGDPEELVYELRAGFLDGLEAAVAVRTADLARRAGGQRP